MLEGAEEDLLGVCSKLTLMAGDSHYRTSTHTMRKTDGARLKIRRLFLAGCVLKAGAVVFGQLAPEPGSGVSPLSMAVARRQPEQFGGLFHRSARRSSAA